MNIQHEPLFDTAKVEEHYTQKDNTDVKYVCTTDLRESDRPMDIFYRSTPHPKFGNRYFGLFWGGPCGQHLMITDADIIESLEFGMIEVDGKYHYSQSHHDYRVIKGKMIDGGRQYIRSSGDAISMLVKNSKFYAVGIEDLIDIHNKENNYE